MTFWHFSSRSSMSRPGKVEWHEPVVCVKDPINFTWTMKALTRSMLCVTVPCMYGRNSQLTISSLSNNLTEEEGKTYILMK